MDIYVGNLSYDATDADLEQLFAKQGRVASARVVIDRMSGRSKGFGFVEMPDQAEAEKAIQNLNGTEFMGRTLRVNQSQPRPRGEGGSNRFRGRQRR